MVTYGFDRAKIPKTLSFPLKRSGLDAALDAAGVVSLAAVYYWMRQRGDVVLRADYLGEARRGWAQAGQSTVTVYAVPAAERRETESALLREALPRLVAWLRAADAAGNAWRGADHHLAVSYRAGNLQYDEYD